MGMTAMVGLSLGGAALGAAGTLAAGDYNKEIADYNAKVAELQAADALDRGAEAEGRHRVNVRGLIGAQRAALAAQGVDVASGSALEVQLDTAGRGEVDALRIRSNAAREAWGYEVQATDSRMRGELAQMEAKSRATSTILGGAGSAYSYWSKG